VAARAQPLNESCKAQNMSDTPTLDDFDEAHGYKRFSFSLIAFD
jgi:hypothetical protein